MYGIRNNWNYPRSPVFWAQLLCSFPPLQSELWLRISESALSSADRSFTPMIFALASPSCIIAIEWERVLLHQSVTVAVSTSESTCCVINTIAVHVRLLFLKKKQDERKTKFAEMCRRWSRFNYADLTSERDVVLTHGMKKNPLPFFPIWVCFVNPVSQRALHLFPQWAT